MTSISCIKIAKNLQMMHLKTSLEVQIETLELLKCTFSFIEEPLFKPQNNFNLCLRKRIDWQLTCKITRQFHQDDPSEWQQSSNHKFPHFCHQPICSFHPPVANPPEKNGDLVNTKKNSKIQNKFLPGTLLSLWFSWLFENGWKNLFFYCSNCLFVSFFEYSWSFDLLSGSMDRSAFFPANLQNKSEGLVKSIQPIISTLLTHHHISWLSSLIIITKACLFSFYIEHVIRNAVTTDLRNPLGNLCVLSYGLRSEDVIEWTIEGISLFPPWHLWRKRLGKVRGSLPVIYRFV